MTYMTLHRIGQYLVDPQWPRLAFLNGAPMILDTAVDVTVDVGEVEEISVGDLWRWCAGDSHAARAWRHAIEEFEASCRAWRHRIDEFESRAREGMYRKWLGQETEPRHTHAWACHARAAQARSHRNTRAWQAAAQAARSEADSHALEIRAAIAAHDASR